MWLRAVPSARPKRLRLHGLRTFTDISAKPGERVKTDRRDAIKRNRTPILIETRSQLIAHLLPAVSIDRHRYRQ